MISSRSSTHSTNRSRLISLSEKRRRYIPALILYFILQFIVYEGTQLFTKGAYHFCMATALDSMIPLVPWTVVFYVSWYPFVVVNYFLATFQEENRVSRFLAAAFLSKPIYFVIFLLLPTTMTRPPITDPSCFGRLVSLVYQNDAPVNLFPSLHCFESWMCFIAVRRNRAVPRAYRAFSFCLALLICVSTVTVKQHVLADTFAGVALAEGIWQLAGYAGLDKGFARIYTRMLRSNIICFLYSQK